MKRFTGLLLTLCLCLHRFCSSRPRKPRCARLAQHGLRRLPLSRNEMVRRNEAWRVHDASGRAAEGVSTGVCGCAGDAMKSLSEIFLVLKSLSR
jgi:hypothetical protein